MCPANATPRPARSPIAVLLVPAILLLLPAGITFSQDAPPSIPAAMALLNSGDAAKAAAMLEAVTKAEPENGRAWSMLGLALRRKGDLDLSIEACRKAAGFPEIEPVASYNCGLVYGLKGDGDRAFEWLGRAKATGKIDMTQIAFDSDSEPLRKDPRYAGLFPDRDAYARPFVESATVLADWTGEAAGDQFGWIARNIGDVDGDGVNDLTTSAPTNGEGAGKVYVYSGKSGALLWAAKGSPGASLGIGIEAAGDVNADGVPDVIAGAPGTGRAFVYSGVDGAVLLEFAAENKDDLFGRKVADLGDVNGDGHADVLIGAPGNDAAGKDAGRSYVRSGKDGALLLTLDGEAPGDGFGSSGAGLVRNGRITIVVGAGSAGPAHHGRVYVYNDLKGKPAFVIESDETGVNLGGMFVSVVGDVDRDGIADVYASDWSNAALGRATGRVYVHSGADGRRLLTLTGETAGDGFGIGPADAGDVNGDGHADLVIGAWRFSGAAPSAGKVYVYSGKDGSLLSAITDRVPGETFGFDATGLGDVNGDGVIDYLLTSAWSSINGPRSGRMVVVSGKITAG